MPQVGFLARQQSFISGLTAPNSVLRFYRTGTSTPQSVFIDSALSNAVTSLTADAAGLLAKWYLNPNAAADYRYTLESAAGAVYYIEDDIPRNPLTQAAVGETLYPRTDEESAAAVTPTNYAYAPGDVRRYGAIGDDATDNATSLSNARAVAAQGVEITFHEGVYRYSIAPNWAVNGVSLRAIGAVELKFTGTGNCVVFDGGPNLGDNIYNCRMVGNFTISGNASATNGLYVRGVHHSTFEARVRDVSAAGCDINFCVGSTFSVKTTASLGAFAVTPVNGCLIKGRTSGEYTAWCQFHNTAIDYCSGFCIDIIHASGCSFFGGFAEYSFGGVRIQDTNFCQNNSFYGFDCEQNSDYDWEIHGQHNRLIGCTGFSNAANDNLIVADDAVGTQIIGGYHKVCTLQAGSADTTLINVSFANTTIGITGTGSYRSMGCYLIDSSPTPVRTSSLTDVYGLSGTFTPTIIGSSTAGTQTYTAQVGHYRKVGDLVEFQLYVAISAKGGGIAGNITIGGLPFTQKSTSNLFTSFAMGDYVGLTNAAGRTQFMARGSAGTSVITIIEAGSGVSSQAVPVSALASTALLVISGTYIAD